MDNVTPPSPSDEGLTRPDSYGGKRGMTDFDGLPVLIPVPRAAELLGISRVSTDITATPLSCGVTAVIETINPTSGGPRP